VSRVLLRALPLVLLAAAPARASEGGDLFYPTLNFVLLFGTLFFLLRVPLRTYFAERRAAVRKDVEDAAALKKQAEERYAKWQRRLGQLEEELEGIRTTARERAETEREHMLADARATAERMRQDAAAAVDQELRRARESLRQEASQLAVELAAGILREQVTPGDRERLLDEFIGRIERSPEAGS
jgi:F-type H+-transporting ATPase subunit b